MRFFCIADADTVRGFRLAGIDGWAVSSADQAAARLEEAAEQPDLDILILTEWVVDGVREQVNTIRLQRDRPLIVEIPGPLGPSAHRRTLGQLVREAVGFRVDRKQED